MLSALEEAIVTEEGAFDVISLFQVLERIADFRGVLTRVNKLLRPGGKLVITVPGSDAMIRQERVTGCHDMPPNHIVNAPLTVLS